MTHYRDKAKGEDTRAEQTLRDRSTWMHMTTPSRKSFWNQGEAVLLQVCQSTNIQVDDSTRLVSPATHICMPPLWNTYCLRGTSDVPH
jgi:hypothetical protein